MALKLGNDYLVWVETAVPGTYALPSGQQSGELSQSTATFDGTTKDSGGFAVQGVGTTSVSLNTSFLVNLPDTAYTRLETISNTVPRGAIKVQIRKGGTAGVDADKVFAASFYISDFSASFPQNGFVAVSPKFVLALAPTTSLTLS